MEESFANSVIRLLVDGFVTAAVSKVYKNDRRNEEADSHS